MTFYLPMLILSLEMLLTYQFTQSMFPALLTLSCLYTPLFFRIRSRRVAHLLCIPGAIIAVHAGWRCLGLLNPLVTILLITQLLQVACYILASPLSTSRSQYVVQTRAAANTPFFTLGFIPVYVAFSHHSSFLPSLLSGSIGTALLVMLALQIENCVAPFSRNRIIPRLSFSWIRLGVVLVMISSTLTVAGFCTPRLQDLVDGVGDWISSLSRPTQQSAGGAASRSAATTRGGPPSRYRVGDRLELEGEYDVKLPHTPDLHLVVHGDDARRVLQRRRFYIKCATFDSFSGKQWYTASRKKTLLRDADDGRRDGTIVVKQVVPNPITYTICLRSCPSRWMPGIPTVVAIHQRVVEQYANDLYASPVPLTNVATVAYSMISSDLRWNDLSPGLQIPGKTNPLYTRLPPGPLSDKIRQETQRIVGHSRQPRLVINKLLAHLQMRCQYSSRTHNPDNHHPIDNFLFHEKKGHCELFASSFTLMLRAAGIPARMSAGYCGGEYDDQYDMYTFFRDDGHSWVEVYLQKYGWVTIEPTPPDSRLAPSLPRLARRQWNFRTSDYPLLADLVNIGFPNDGGDTGRTRRWYEALPGFMTPVFILNILIVIGAILYVILLRRAGRSPSGRSGTARTHTPPSFFKAFCRHFAKLGCTIRRGQTASEYLQELKSRELIDDKYDDLVTYFESITYAQLQRSASLERSFKSALRS